MSWWHSIGSAILRKKKELQHYEFKKYFKLSAPLVEIVFNEIRKRFNCQAKHLLWTLHYLKTTSTNEAEIAALLGVNVDTMRIHVERTLRMLIIFLPNV